MKKTSFEKIKEERIFEKNKKLKTSYELGKDYFDETSKNHKNLVELSEDLLKKHYSKRN
ncbi:MAG: hypothetical protein IJX78_05450 [Bacilli bacterium]|nr:hypothetical protein [Bacilli bacterium]